MGRVTNPLNPLSLWENLIGSRRYAQSKMLLVFLQMSVQRSAAAEPRVVPEN
jgi:hypothetical protein